MELKKHQPSMSLDGQIANLRELGLIIDDEKSAVHFLNDVSYYRFIKAYSLGLKPKNSVYSDGVTFELLKDLYIFNCNFRQLIFPLIERIEVNLRCRVSNYFCEKYGVLGYLNYDNFSIKEYHDEFLGQCGMDGLQGQCRGGLFLPDISGFLPLFSVHRGVLQPFPPSPYAQQL